jgi:uncharacterized protein YcbX
MGNVRGEEIGTVVGVWRYPVKSMRGESLDRAELTWNGLDGDRRHAFVLEGDRSRFPWLTGRRAAALLRYAPTYQDPANLRKSPLRVGLPEGGALDLHAPELRQRLEAEAGGPLGLIQVGRGIFDSLPVSVMTTATPAAIGAVVPAGGEPRRYRANIVIDAGPDAAHREAQWVGGRLAFGDTEGPVLRVNKRIDRCSMVTIDPDTAGRDPDVLKTVVDRAENRIGAYASAEALGWIAVGDKVWLQR